MATSVSRTFGRLSRIMKKLKAVHLTSQLIGSSRCYSSTGSSSGGQTQDKSSQKTEQKTTKPVVEGGIKANKKAVFGRPVWDYHPIAKYCNDENQSRINSTGKGFEDTTYMAKEYYRNGMFSFYDIEFDMQKSRLQQPSSLKKTS